MRIIRPSMEIPNVERPMVFLAGGCKEKRWREYVCDALGKFKNGMIADPYSDEYEQKFEEHKEWEHKMIWSSDIVSFYFSKDGLQAGTLFELGQTMGRFVVGGGPSKIVVSVHKDYELYKDVEATIRIGTRHFGGRYSLSILAHDPGGHAAAISEAIKDLFPNII